MMEFELGSIITIAVGIFIGQLAIDWWRKSRRY